MGSLLIVTGPPGAGKSTVATVLAERVSPSVLVAGDDFFSFLAQGAIAPWLPESNAQNEVVTEAAAASTGRFARDFHTIYDGVIGPWFLSTFAAATGLAALDYAVILPSVEACVARVRSRRGHGFGDEPATRKMHAEFADATIERRHVLGGDPVQDADPVAMADAIDGARTEGRLRHLVGSGIGR